MSFCLNLRRFSGSGFSHSALLLVVFWYGVGSSGLSLAGAGLQLVVEQVYAWSTMWL
jgi:hypothetical protein